MPDAIECEHLPTQVGYDDELQSGRDPDEDDFNKANLRLVMPNFHQHVSCPTRGPNTLDHCYSQFKNAYRARLLPALANRTMPPFFLTPEYKQRLAQEPPGKREVTRWSSHSEAMLQAALDDVDWDMFRASSSDVSESQM